MTFNDRVKDFFQDVAIEVYQDFIDKQLFDVLRAQEATLIHQTILCMLEEGISVEKINLKLLNRFDLSIDEAREHLRRAKDVLPTHQLRTYLLEQVLVSQEEAQHFIQNNMVGLLITKNPHLKTASGKEIYEFINNQ